MAIVFNWRTSATLYGARDFSRIHRVAQQEDVGFKLERTFSAISILLSALSAINVLQSAVSQIHLALGSAAASMAGASLFSAFSAFSAGASPGAVSTMPTIALYSTISNFRASGLA